MPIMLPSETRIWQPELPDKILSLKTGVVQLTRLGLETQGILPGRILNLGWMSTRKIGNR
ncbi:hypothetical protein AXT60_24970 [Salmonella enterica subsp. enterica]|nr:hypothetical protein [Salmonella enterica subsp. enterica]ECJ6738155.1 hypothetical protein [Salmonella enterica subsp. enterica]